MAEFSYCRTPLQALGAENSLEEGEEILHTVGGVACSVARFGGDEEEEEEAESEGEDENLGGESEGERVSLEDWGVGALIVTTRRLLWRADAPTRVPDALSAFSVRVALLGLHASSVVRV